MEAPAGPPAPLPAPPDAAAEVFGARLPLAWRFAELLATAGLTRGLIGPREVPRLWDRHLINCALLTELLPDGARVVDVGSGAGLPGLALACRRADLRIDLVEPMQRRVDFLHEATRLLDLDTQVRVVRGRAEDDAVRAMVGRAPWVTARAVAPLPRLLAWCLPLLGTGGALLAMKGERAADELRELRSEGRWRGVSADLVYCGEGVLDRPVGVVVVRTNGKGGGWRR